MPTRSCCSSAPAQHPCCRGTGLERAACLLNVVDRCEGELRQAIDVLHDAADLSLTAAEQLTLCAIELEALLLPEVDSELNRTFARRLANCRWRGGRRAGALHRAQRGRARRGRRRGAAGLAQALLARAVVALEALTREESTLPELRARLDEGQLASKWPTDGVPAPTPRMLHPPPRRSAPSSSGLALAGGLVLSDPEIGDGELVLFAPLIGLELDDLPDPLLEAGFPLTWLWPWQVGSLEDPDIRRDWMSRDSGTARVTGCLALHGERDVDAALAPLLRRVDGRHRAAAGGPGDRAGRGATRCLRARRLRRAPPASLGLPPDGLRVALQRSDALEPAVADLAALWSLLLAYEAGPPAPEIDHALALFRRAHSG